MDSLWTGADALWRAILANDAWMIADALKHPATYWIVGVAILPLAALILALFRAVPPVERHLERTVLIVTYMAIAMIIFVEVIRRFVFSVQAPWSTTLPPFLFLIMTWVGCSWNVRLRSHLSFAEFRNNFPRGGQMACAALDAVLWFAFGVIVIVATLRQTANSASNFQFLLGTDDVMQWWFYVAVPIAWVVLCARVLENFLEDLARYRAGRPVFMPSAATGD
jgi:TRAP-type C4-dicarboxylate transport system permease small subunit